MKILNLSGDSAILNPESKPAKRIIKYGTAVEMYRVVVFNRITKTSVLSNNTIVHGVGGLRFIALIKMYFLAAKICREHKIDVITTQDPFELALIGYLLKLRYRVALNIQEHGDFFSATYWRNENIKNFIRYYVGGYLLPQADSIRVVSQRIKNNLISKFNIDESKIVVVSVYVKLDRPMSESILSLADRLKDRTVILTMARLVKQKNIPLLISAFDLVVKKIPNAVLLIVGQGPEKNILVEQVEQLNLANKVIFCDWAENVDDYYRLADLYALSSNYEGWAMVIIEAASHGLPIVMTDVGCAGEVIKDGINGLVIPIGDKDALSNSLISLIEDKELRQKMSDGARNAIVSLGDEQNNLQQYLASWSVALNKSQSAKIAESDQDKKMTGLESGSKNLIDRISGFFSENRRELAIITGVIIVNLIIRLFYVNFLLNSDAYQYIATGKLFWGVGNEVFPFRILKPLAPWLTGLIATISGLTYQSSFIVEIFVFYFLLGYISFAFFKYFFNSKGRGLIGAILYLTAYPVIMYGIDLYTETGAWFFWVLSAYLSLIYFRRKEYLYLNILVIILGMLWKEYSFIAWALLLLTIFFHPQLAIKEKIKNLSIVFLIVTLFLVVLQVITYHYYQYTYIYYYSIGNPPESGSVDYHPLAIIKSIFATFSLGWILVLGGLSRYFTSLTKSQRLFLYLMIIPSFMFLLWGGVSSRLYFVVAPFLVLLGLIGISDKFAKTATFKFLMLAIIIFNYYWLLV